MRIVNDDTSLRRVGSERAPVSGPRSRRHLSAAGALAVTIALLASTTIASGTVPESGTQAGADVARTALDLDVAAGAVVDDPPGPSAPAGGDSPATPDVGTLMPNLAAASATPGPTPTPGPAIAPPVRSRTVAAPVPRSLLATLGTASTAMPLPYLDGCHGAPASTMRCFYGNLRSKTTIALFGDSHALSWFPAVLRLAQDRGWRVLDLTRSACGPADIIPYNRIGGYVMVSCETWRAGAIARLVQVHPAIILVSGTRGFATVDAAGTLLTGKAKTNAWIAGMKRTLAKLVPAAGRVILLADTPSSLFARPAACLAGHPDNELACATAVAHAISYPWLNTEFEVAKAMTAGYLNLERWVCPTSPCPAVIGTRLVYRNPGHLTVSFTSSQWLRLERAILADLARRTTVPGP